MITTFILLLFILILGLTVLSGYKASKNKTRSYSMDGDGRLFVGGIGLAVAVIGLAVTTLTVSFTGYDYQNSANSVYSKLDVVEAQRDQMVALVRDELSAEQLEVLTEA